MEMSYPMMKLQKYGGKLDEKYVVASVDVANIKDENIRHIYDHVDEDVPDLKFKFDIDADVEGKSNLDKAKTLLTEI